MRYLLLCWLCLILSLSGLSQGFLKASGKEIVDGNGNVVLLRGMGLGGWMLQEPYMLKLSGIAQNQKQIRSMITDMIGKERTAEFYTAWLKNHCTKADIDSMAAWGFNSVRLPFHYDLFTYPVEQEKVKGQQTWKEEGFIMIDSLLSWCEQNRIYLILDMHAAPGGQGSDIPISDRDPAKPSLWQEEQNQVKTIALWKKLAERYVNEKWIGAYDLLNETNWGFQDSTDKNGCSEKLNAPLRKLLIDITAAIREVDKNHMIIIEGNCWGNNYNGVFPLWDDNIVVSFHKYWNENDQGSVQHFVDLREKYNVPVWMGESGENSNSWFTSAISLLEKNNIGWAWWPLKKMGINNPLQIPSNPRYDHLLKYWKGEASRPSADDAYDGLMQLASDATTGKNVYHREVVDAMFRQVGSGEALSYSPHPIKKSAVVYAVNFDMGRLGSAYYSTDSANYRVSRKENTPWNKGWRYRNEAVDIDSCTDASNGLQVMDMKPGEWLQYTVFVHSAGNYSLYIRSMAKKDAVMQLIANGNKPVEIIMNASTPFKWADHPAENIQLKKGVNVIRIRNQSGEFSMNTIRFRGND